MTELEQLIAREDIRQVFARRVRHMDMKEWDKYGPCHTDDAWSESYGDMPADMQPKSSDGAPNKVVGPDALARQIEYFIMHNIPLDTAHHAHQDEINFTSNTTATGIWAMEDHLWWQNGDTVEMLHGYGHYHETYRKVGGQWLISYRKLTRLRVDVTPNFYDRLR